MAEEQKDGLVNLTIDGKPISVAPGTLVWAAAKEAGIEIPIYCYHPKMPPLGACRMCFVEVENMPKPPQTACTTPVAEGMVVHTKTEKVLKARQGTLEFLLINHPLDCPICDKGGECDLQDFTLRHGPGGTRFDLQKRHYQKPIPVSNDVMLDRERCILCQRCTRFSSEISMDNGLVMISRGYKMEVGTAPNHAFDSNFSGNTVEICPVGALTATQYRFKSRPWELRKTASICNGCSVGCNVRVDTRVDRVLRQMSRTNDGIDDGWLCNRGRWDLDFVNNPERIRTPLIKRNGQFEKATWEEALGYVADRLREIAAKDGPSSIAGIGSTRVTNEEAYLFQKVLRQTLGTSNVDHYHGRFDGVRDSVSGKPWMLTNSIEDIEKASHILLFAADPYQRQPILDLRIKKAIKAGAKIFIVNAEATELDRFATRKITLSKENYGIAARTFLEAVLAQENLQGSKQDLVRQRLAKYQTTSHIAADLQRQLFELAGEYASASAAMLFYDEFATLETGAEHLASYLHSAAVVAGQLDKVGAGVGPLFEDANSLGARDMGLLPNSGPGYEKLEKPGLSYEEIFAAGSSVKALYVMGANPVRHLPDGFLSKSLEFIVVQDLEMTVTAQQADVILPAVSYAEKDGSMTNVDHHVQNVRRALRPLPGAKADWQILTELAGYLGESWNYAKPAAILTEIAQENPLYADLNVDVLGKQGVRTQEQEVARA